MVQKGLFFIMGNTHILISYLLVYSFMIKGLEGWNNVKTDMEISGGIQLIVLLGLINDEYWTNDSNYGGIYCTVLDTSVSLLIWYMLIHLIR